MLALMAAVQGCSVAREGGSSLVLRDVVISSYSDKPPLSGLLQTWISVNVKELSGITHELFIPYLREDTYFPEVGTICDIYYHYGDIRGLVGTKSANIQNAKIVDKFAEKDPV